MRILGDAALTRKPFDHQNGEHGIVAARDVRARGQLVIVQDQSFHLVWTSTYIVGPSKNKTVKIWAHLSSNLQESNERKKTPF